MSKISYILGTGASYYTRVKSSDETFLSLPNIISRGLPILQEFPYALEQLTVKLESANEFSAARK